MLQHAMAQWHLPWRHGTFVIALVLQQLQLLQQLQHCCNNVATLLQQCHGAMAFAMALLQQCHGMLQQCCNNCCNIVAADATIVATIVSSKNAT